MFVGKIAPTNTAYGNACAYIFRMFIYLFIVHTVHFAVPVVQRTRGLFLILFISYSEIKETASRHWRVHAVRTHLSRSEDACHYVPLLHHLERYMCISALQSLIVLSVRNCTSPPLTRHNSSACVPCEGYTNTYIQSCVCLEVICEQIDTHSTPASSFIF